MGNLANRARKPVTDYANNRAGLAKNNYMSQAVRTGKNGKPILRDRLRGMSQSFTNRKKQRDLMSKAYEAQADERWNKEIAANADTWADQLQGEGAQQAMRTIGAGVVAEIETRETKNSDARLANMRVGQGATPLTTGQLLQIYKGENVTDRDGSVIMTKDKFSEYDRIAAVQRAASVANVDEANTILNATTDSTMPVSVRKAGAKAGGTAPVASKAFWMGGKTIANAEQTGIGAADATIAAILDGKANAEALAGGDDASTKWLLDTVAASANDTDELAAKKTKARAMLQAEAQKIFAENSHLGERVTAGSEKSKNLNSMIGFADRIS
jgi:hypothetical protein